MFDNVVVYGLVGGMYVVYACVGPWNRIVFVEQKMVEAAAKTRMMKLKNQIQQHGLVGPVSMPWLLNSFLDNNNHTTPKPGMTQVSFARVIVDPAFSMSLIRCISASLANFGKCAKLDFRNPGFCVTAQDDSG